MHATTAEDLDKRPVKSEHRISNNAPIHTQSPAIALAIESRYWKVWLARKKCDKTRQAQANGKRQTANQKARRVVASRSNRIEEAREKQPSLVVVCCDTTGRQRKRLCLASE
jgi:hypothetical protein